MEDIKKIKLDMNNIPNSKTIEMLKNRNEETKKMELNIDNCVGCGRCLSRCPISMNIVKVMKKLGGNENAE